jgi:MYXO-CTERM domain-containing protein
VACPAPTACQDASTCDAQSGVCSAPLNKPDGAACPGGTCANGACVPVPAGGGDGEEEDGGCGCKVAPGATPTPGPLCAGVGLLLLLRRRRSRSARGGVTRAK